MIESIMSTTLQKTKLFPPVNRLQLVERPRLFERLNHLLIPDCKVGIISAPAGSGKTTVINQWLTNQKCLQSAWISLDDRDNDLSIFLRYLIKSLQCIHPDIGKKAKTLVNLPGLDLNEFVTLLTNDLAEHKDQFIVILDDFHVINNSRIVEAMSLLLEAKPVWFKIVLLTREDPDIRLARWRARGQLVELRQDDLRFTLPETVVFLKQCMGLELSIEQVEHLEKSTEGWIAGLQLAALSIQRTKNKDRFVNDFSGTHRFVLDYLMDEVFSNQQQDIQSFLLETSILENMNASLCAAITGKEKNESQSMLEHLVRTNLFLFPLDDQQHWYRYHHLFKDLLLARLQSLEKARINQLYGCASNWYEKEGEARLAVEYALKGKDLTLAADLIEQHISQYWQTSDWDFMSLLTHLPNEEIEKRPSLCLHKAWINVITGQMDGVLPFIYGAEKHLDDVDRKGTSLDEPLRAIAKILRTYMLDLKNETIALDGSLSDAYARIPDDFVGMRNSVAIILGTIYYMENDFSTAMYYFEDALERDKRLKGTNAIPISVQRMAWVFLKQGHLHKVMELTKKYDKYVRQRGVRGYYIAGVQNLLMGEIYLEWNQLEEAEKQISEGLRLIKDWPNPAIVMIGYCLLTRLHIAKNNLSDAEVTFMNIEELLFSNQFHPEFVNILEQTQLQLWIETKKRLALESFVSTKSPLVSLPLTFRNEAVLIGLSRAWLALGEFDKARSLLTRLAAFTKGRKGSHLLILLMLVNAHKEQTDLAEKYLEEALHLAEPEGYIRTFLNIGEPLWKLLKNWFTKNQNTSDEVLKAYAYKIILAFEKSTIRDSQIEKESDLPEPLSKREREVLQLVSEGLTNQQIATRLVISIRTVKKHIENIHGKLGVQNRTQATNRARSLGLLDNDQ